MRVENGGVGEDPLDHLDAVKDIDQPRVMVVEGAQNRTACQLLKLLQLDVGERGASVVCDIEPGQRTDAIGAVGIAEGL